MDVDLLTAEGPTISLADFKAIQSEAAWSNPQDENYLVLRLDDEFLGAIFQTNVADGGEFAGKTLFEKQKFGSLELAKEFLIDRFGHTLKTGS